MRIVYPGGGREGRGPVKPRPDCAGPPMVATTSDSEAEAESQLDDPGFTPTAGLPEVLHAARHEPAGVVGGESGVETPDLRMVEQVEDLTAEGRLERLFVGEVLD